MHYLREKRGQKRVKTLGFRLCPQCGDDMSRARQNSMYCSTRCQTAAWVDANIDVVRLRRRMSQSKRKAAKYGNPGYKDFGIQDWLDLVKFLDHRCTYGGEQLDASELELDHIVPLRRGGAPTVSPTSRRLAAHSIKAGSATLDRMGSEAPRRKAPLGQDCSTGAVIEPMETGRAERERRPSASHQEVGCIIPRTSKGD